MVVYTLNKSQVIHSPIEDSVFFLDRFCYWENEENESQERTMYNYIEE